MYNQRIDFKSGQPYYQGVEPACPEADGWNPVFAPVIFAPRSPQGILCYCWTCHYSLLSLQASLSAKFIRFDITDII